MKTVDIDLADSGCRHPAYKPLGESFGTTASGGGGGPAHWLRRFRLIKPSPEQPSDNGA